MKDDCVAMTTTYTRRQTRRPFRSQTKARLAKSKREKVEAASWPKSDSSWSPKSAISSKSPLVKKKKEVYLVQPNKKGPILSLSPVFTIFNFSNGDDDETKQSKSQPVSAPTSEPLAQPQSLPQPAEEVDLKLSSSPTASLPHTLSDNIPRDTYLEDKFANLSKAVIEFAKKQQLTPTEQSLRQSVISNLASFIWQHIQAESQDFGSFSQGLATKESDIDLALFLPPSSHALSALHYLFYPFQTLGSVEPLFHARVPILKVSLSLGLVCDISVFTPDSHVLKADLIKRYTICHPLVIPFVLFVKYWAKKRSLASANIGMLHTFGWVLLCLQFLQRRKPPVLPVIDIGRIRSRLEWESKNTETLGQLLLGFFIFHSQTENWNHCFSVRTGCLEDADHFLSPQRSSLRIEDPIEIEQNLGRNIHMDKLKTIVCEFNRARELLLEASKPEQNIRTLLTTLCAPIAQQRGRVVSSNTVLTQEKSNLVLWSKGSISVIPPAFPQFSTTQAITPKLGTGTYHQKLSERSRQKEGQVVDLQPRALTTHELIAVEIQVDS